MNRLSDESSITIIIGQINRRRPAYSRSELRLISFLPPDHCFFAIEAVPARSSQKYRVRSRDHSIRRPAAAREVVSSYPGNSESC